MGGDHEYGRGDAPGDGSRAYGGGRRGYGSADNQAEQARGHGERSYGSSAGSADGGSGGARGYGVPDSGGARGYGDSTRGYEAPVDSYGAYGGTRGSRGRGAAIPGEVVSPDSAGTRQLPGLTGQSAGGDGDAVGTAPRRSRLEERQAARNGSAEYAPGQERSTRYRRSAIDGRSTRNGAGRRGAGPGGPDGPGGRGPGRPVKKTGYHRYFDYPRTGKVGWRQFVPSIKQVCSFVLGGFFLLIGLIAFEYATVQIPSENSIATQQVTSYTYDDGSSTFATYGKQNRQNVDISQIPMVMQNAIIAAEDKTFRTNNGISYTGIARSILNDLEGKPLQGGSTLTQQFVKNAYLNQNQTFTRKLDEVFIALKIGKTQSKDWVMQNYLNTVFFGRNSYGIEAASKAWFGKDVNQITDPAQAAFLAAMVNQPTNFSKGWDSGVISSDPQTAAYWVSELKLRWKAVLDNMLGYGLINQADHDKALTSFPTPAAQASVTGETVQQQQMQTAVSNWIESYAAANPGSNIPSLQTIEAGGYTVVTTFNQHYMDLAQQAVQESLLSKLHSSNWYDQNLYPALAAVDPTTGELVAFYGGTTQFNWATQGQMQPGSTFKAFTLATAFKQNISPNSYINGDSPWPNTSDPTEVAAAKGDPKVTNDDGSHGQIDINTATAASVNTAFVRLSNQVGYSNVMQTINDLGINSHNAQGLTPNARLTLGISAVSPARMASAYSTFADNGSQYPLIMVKEIKTAGGVDWKPTITPKQVLDSNVAETVTQTLTHVTHDSDGTGAAAPGESGLTNIAGKTGTSTMDLGTLQQKYPDVYAKTQNGHYDTAATWFNGFTTKLETAVSLSRWITEPNPSAGQAGQPATIQIQAPVDNIENKGFSFGADYPLAIWSDFMKLMQGTKSKFVGDNAFPQPNIGNMTVSGSPVPSTSSAPATTKAPNPGQSNQASPTLSDSPSATATPSCGGLSAIFGGCQSSSPSSSGSPSSSRTKGGGGGLPSP